MRFFGRGMFFRRGTYSWSSEGRSIRQLGGSPTVADQPKSRGARWNHWWLDTSICGNLKDGVFCCLSQTYLYFLCLSITNYFNLWAWPRRVDADRTVLKISCVNYFYYFYVITCYSHFPSLQVQSHPVATDRKLVKLII